MTPIFYLKKNKVSFSARLSSNILLSRTEVGSQTYIGCNCVINNAEIGSYCSIAPGVQIGGMEHSYWWLSTSTNLSDQCISNRKTVIGNDVWIAAGTIVKQGVKIGNGAVIGAMSFVNKDVEENSVYFGQPAKLFKKRMDDKLFLQLQESCFWDYTPARAKAILAEIEKLASDEFNTGKNQRLRGGKIGRKES